MYDTFVTYFRHRAVQTVVDTTKEAEFDFALHGVCAQVQERIGRALKETPRSQEDRICGDVRLRRIGEWDVLFIIAYDPRGWVITIGGVEPAGNEMESQISYLMRVLLEALPAPVRALLQGRKKKP